MTTSSHPAPGNSAHTDGARRLEPMRGIFVSLGLGAAAWTLIAAAVVGIRALLS